MICNFYQHSPYDIDRTIVIASYEVTKETVPLFIQKMEDYMAFHFLLHNYCSRHNPGDVTIHTFDLSNERMYTIYANCGSCCKTHYENMHHVNFHNLNCGSCCKTHYENMHHVNVHSFIDGIITAAKIQARNEFLGVRSNQRKTPTLIYQWPLLVVLYCFSLKNRDDIFV